MKVNRGSLLQTLESVSSGLSTREIVEHSNSFCFLDQKVYTYNDEIATIAKSPLDITGAVPAEPLKEILLKMREEILEFEQDSGKLTIRGKGQTISIKMEKKINLPIDSLIIPKKWRRLPAEFCEGLKQVEHCAGRDEAQFNLTCIHIHPNWVEAFDRFQFGRYAIKTGLKQSVLVRQSSIKQIVDLEMAKFAESDQWIHFKNSTGLMFACRRYTESYPALSEIAKLSGKQIQFPKVLAEIAERAEVFTRLDPTENNIRVDLKPGAVHVKGEGIYGSYEGFKKVTYNEQPFSFMIHPQMLSQLVKKHPVLELCTGEDQALKGTAGSFVFVASLIKPKKTAIETPKKKLKKAKVA